jgi:hypothetical protein
VAGQRVSHAAFRYCFATMRTFVTVSLLTLVLTACGGKKDGDKAGGDKADKAGGDKVASCLSDSQHGCREYSAANVEAGVDLKSLCTTVDKAAKYADVACPTAKVIATCASAEGKDFFYDGYPIGVADIEKDCKASGKTFAKP